MVHQDAESLKKFESVLSHAERARAARYVTSELQRRSIWSRGLLRLLLGKYLGGDPQRILFAENEAGKLFISGSDLKFNVSHSKDRLIYAVAKSRDLGIDVEILDRRVDALEIAQSFFAPGETEFLRTLEGDARHVGFFECWTRKEAFIKAVGLGLSIPLDSFEVSFGPGRSAAITIGGEGWFLIGLRPSIDSVAALAARGDPCPVKQFEWPNGENPEG